MELFVGTIPQSEMPGSVYIPVYVLAVRGICQRYERRLAESSLRVFAG